VRKQLSRWTPIAEYLLVPELEVCVCVCVCVCVLGKGWQRGLWGFKLWQLSTVLVSTVKTETLAQMWLCGSLKQG
jgi:hypothetical protein